jgi:outer membrane protein assembly factor BamB
MNTYFTSKRTARIRHEIPKRMPAIAYLLCAACLMIAPRVLAENWPQFRGPGHQGISTESGLPLKWSETENIAWKTEIPGQSWSSPIVWNNHVFITTALNGGESCHVLAIDRKSGKILWDKTVFKQLLRRKEGRNTFATPTPATDGKRVYACFGDGSFVALNFDGEVAWTNRDHKFYGQHGLGTSAILYNDLLIMARDGSSEGAEKLLGWQKAWDQSYILALDTATGKDRWRAKRGLSRISHSVPNIWEHDGKAELVSEAGDVLQGFDLSTGDRLWSSDVIGESPVPSVVLGDGMAFTAGGWGGKETIKAFKLGGAGDLKETNLLWEQRKAMPKVPSMLYVKPYLYTINDGGIAQCLKADSGEVIWHQRIPGNFSASPVAADGHIYFLNDDGETTVIEVGPAFNELAKNSLGEKVQASMAISQGQLFVRTEKNLWCIGSAKAGKSE